MAYEVRHAQRITQFTHDLFAQPKLFHEILLGLLPCLCEWLVQEGNREEAVLGDVSNQPWRILRGARIRLACRRILLVIANVIVGNDTSVLAYVRILGEVTDYNLAARRRERDERLCPAARS
jgi:hypothetical protein